jgi:hypothetical protein
MANSIADIEFISNLSSLRKKAREGRSDPVETRLPEKTLGGIEGTANRRQVREARRGREARGMSNVWNASRYSAGIAAADGV